MILIIIKFCELLLRISPRIINSLRSRIKHSKECSLLFPNTLKLVKNSRLRCIFQPTSRCLEIGGNTLPHVRYITWAPDSWIRGGHRFEWGGVGGVFPYISYIGGAVDFDHFGLKVWKWVWILETWSENGYKFKRQGLKNGVRNLHILVWNRDLKGFSNNPRCYSHWERKHKKRNVQSSVYN